MVELRYVNGVSYEAVRQVLEKNRLKPWLTRRWCIPPELRSYGFNLTDQYRRPAGCVDKILGGAKPADLPVDLPTKFDFVVNLKVAQALGLTISQTALQQATEGVQ